MYTYDGVSLSDNRRFYHSLSINSLKQGSNFIKSLCLSYFIFYSSVDFIDEAAVFVGFIMIGFNNFLRKLEYRLRKTYLFLFAVWIKISLLCYRKLEEPF